MGELSSISSTLLERVQARRPEAWQRLVELYGPLVYRWCRRAGLGAEDAADAVQDVFREAAEHVGSFRRNGSGGSFTAWLATIARNKVRDQFRRRQGRASARGGTTAQQQLAEVPQPEVDASAFVTDNDAEAWLARKGLELVRAEFENRTWDAFWRTAVDGRPAADVADELGMSVPAVYKARSRVLRRLRQELGGM